MNAANLPLPMGSPAPASPVKSSVFEMFVPGLARPAGSKKGFLHRWTNRVMVVDACAKSKDWKATVSQYAEAEIRARCGLLAAWKPMEGPLYFRAHFLVPRPKGHLRSNGEPKPKAPSYPTTRPDILKLARAVEDALTGIVYGDDSQIVIELITKFYTTETPGVHIRIAPIPQLIATCPEISIPA